MKTINRNIVVKSTVNILKTTFAVFVALVSTTSAVAAINSADVQSMMQQGQYSKALKAVEQQLENQPEDPQYQFLQGYLFEKTGKDKKAVSVYKGLIKDFPELPEAYNNLAVHYASREKYDKASQLLVKGITSHPSYEAMYENLTDVYMHMASLAYSKALEPDEKSAVSVQRLKVLDKLHEEIFDTPVLVVSEKLVLQEKPVIDLVANKKAINTMLKSWAKAWSAQNVDAYLSLYASDFTSENGVTRKEWARQRRVRLKGPAFIDVGVSRADVLLLDENLASVSFVQRYKSNRLNDSVKKMLLLKKRNEDWLILREVLIR